MLAARAGRCLVIANVWAAVVSAPLIGHAEAAAKPVATEARTGPQDAPEGAEPKREQARALFGEGMSKLEEGDAMAALSRFRQSYEIVPSPNSRLMAARMLVRLGRVDEAWKEYAAVVEEAKQAAERDEKYAPTLESAETERDALRASIGLLTIELGGAAPKDGVVIVGDRVVPAGALARPIALPAGPAHVALVAPSVGRQDRTVQITGGAVHEVELTVEPTAAPCAEGSGDSGSGALKAMAFVTGGIGLAGFGLLGVVALTEGSDVMAATGISIGVLGIGTGVTLYALALGAESDSQSSARAAVVAGPGSLGVVGTF